MKQPREAFSIRPPAEIGAGVERPLGRSFETGRPAVREKSTEDALDRHVLNRQRRFAFAAPHLLIRIRKQRIDHVPEARSGIRAVFGAKLFRPDVHIRHVSPSVQTIPPENSLNRPAKRMSHAEIVEVLHSVAYDRLADTARPWRPGEGLDRALRRSTRDAAGILD